MNPIQWLLILQFMFFLSRFCLSADTITQYHFIEDNDEMIISGGKSFALGFFGPENSRNRYVGIWYHQIPDKVVVWVANRDNPITDNSGILRIDSLGNLALFHRNQTLPVWSTNISITGTRNTFAQILDSGNLVLLQNDTRKVVLWQSFDHPSNTWLPSMKLGLNFRTGLNRTITSWKSPDDPGFGNYSFMMNPNGSPQMFLYKGSTPLWRSGPWTGQRWSGMPAMANKFVLDADFVYSEDEVSYSSSMKNASNILRRVTNETGILEGLIWNHEDQRWIAMYSHPNEKCDFYGHCGPNAYCNPYRTGDFECACFPGFEPKSPEAWLLRNGAAGCVRKRGISMCGNGEGFIKFLHVKVPDTSAAHIDTTVGLKQCKEKCLRDCSCMAYASAYSETNRGAGCLTWQGDLFDARTFTCTGQDLYIRVDANELARYTKKGLLQKKGVLAVIIVSSTVVEIKESRRNSDLPFFDFSAISAATNNFSSDNKLGQGGFGPVYKGVLLNGSEVAVKRLSKYSGQGLEEFKNEIVLIAKLQHRNLVRLLGCCVEGEEKMVIYEFLPNKSLDSIIFDESKRSLLDWKKRLEIICGIARGMLYLHQDSRLRVIHRDLKASNVLLDATMNPKISDFGMARIFGAEQIEGNTKHVVGTYGYMSPEYAMHGHFSMKSDVYSFGVLLLEIITGKKNSSNFPDTPSLNLVGHVWELWKENKALEIVDSALADSYSADEFLKCIQIGLLCVQEHATQRPTISTVVFMFGNETTIPLPKHPAFVVKKINKGDTISSSEETNSVNGVTVSVIQAR
ncbi:G-type lectin S-receptor-like serine/threonine-protein kinase RKS1 isoform X9 [Hibiscus syriacus]|uniref:G-type lectin S-receptor-like serine/threonine-protein kinase RKS1 isoform X9 n=1 Tax=Hibiscus syriacus TaxID=106335 RepID=UPI0019224AC1|nr:G-type lectin S-receptor-like serine/threonine-protein kinase RKS1 isoform X9 [Hibiscus syriacus]